MNERGDAAGQPYPGSFVDAIIARNKRPDVRVNFRPFAILTTGIWAEGSPPPGWFGGLSKAPPFHLTGLLDRSVFSYILFNLDMLLKFVLVNITLVVRGRSRAAGIAETFSRDLQSKTAECVYEPKSP
jgi:hypothetical protein